MLKVYSPSDDVGYYNRIIEGEIDLEYDFDSGCWVWVIGNTVISKLEFKGKRARLEILNNATL